MKQIDTRYESPGKLAFDPPYHNVEKPDRTTTVSDVSSPMASESSNDAQFVTPHIQSDLFSLPIRLSTATCGTSSASSQLTRCPKQRAIEHNDQLPRTAGENDPNDVDVNSERNKTQPTSLFA